MVEGIEAVVDPSVAAVEPVGKRTDKENPMVAAATVVAEIVGGPSYLVAAGPSVVEVLVAWEL